MRRPPSPVVVALALATLTAACGGDATGPDVDSDVRLRGAGRYRIETPLPTGGTIRYTLYVPEGATPTRPVPLVLAAHFGGQVTPWLGGDFADILVVPGFQDLPAVIVAPDAGSTGGWSEADEARVLWLVERLLAVYPIDPERVVVTGFSAGGGQTWAWANRNQDLFTAAIPVSARPRDTASPWTIPIQVVHSRGDELIPFADVEAYVSAQQGAGAPIELHLVDGISHYDTNLFAPALRAAVARLVERWP